MTISSVLYDERFPSLGIVISFSGMNLETAEKYCIGEMKRCPRKLEHYILISFQNGI